MEAKIGAVVRRPWQVEAVQKTLATAGVAPDRCLVGVVDPGSSEAASGFVKGVEDSLGPIVAMVSAAGAFRMAPFGDEPTDTAEQLWRANFASPTLLARAVVMPMRRRRSGALVFTGARAVLEPAPRGMSLYLASKAALHTLAVSLAAELEEHGIRVNLLAPGILDTAANRAAMPNADRRNWMSPAAVAQCLLDLATAPASEPVVVCP